MGIAIRKALTSFPCLLTGFRLLPLLASSRMSAVAKAQGIIWGRRHPEQIEAAVVEMAEDYRKQYSSDPGGRAIEFIEDDSGAVAPELKASSLAYSRMYPDEYKDALVSFDFIPFQTTSGSLSHLDNIHPRTPTS